MRSSLPSLYLFLKLQGGYLFGHSLYQTEVLRLCNSLYHLYLLHSSHFIVLRRGFLLGWNGFIVLGGNILGKWSLNLNTVAGDLVSPHHTLKPHMIGENSPRSSGKVTMSLPDKWTHCPYSQLVEATAPVWVVFHISDSDFAIWQTPCVPAWNDSIYANILSFSAR